LSLIGPGFNVRLAFELADVQWVTGVGTADLQAPIPQPGLIAPVEVFTSSPPPTQATVTLDGQKLLRGYLRSANAWEDNGIWQACFDLVQDEAAWLNAGQAMAKPRPLPTQLKVIETLDIPDLDLDV
jgi:hypothetical protein